MIAFFGMGLLGSSFVRALRRRGEVVQVWNRSLSKALALESEGVKAFGDPAEAASGAERVHVTLSDDSAVDDVLERAREGFARDAVIVDHTTTSPVGTAERARRWADRGIAFQHAPVFMGPQNVLEGTGTMLASGDRARFDALSPALSKMTGKLVYVGAQPERAATFKLLGNSFLMALTAGVVDVIALGRAAGLAPNEAISIFDVFNPATMIQARARRIVDADFEHPSWELAMARKDARLMLEAAAAGHVPLTVVPAVAKVMDRWIASGHGGDDWTVIARDALDAK